MKGSNVFLLLKWDKVSSFVNISSCKDITLHRFCRDSVSNCPPDTRRPGKHDLSLDKNENMRSDLELDWTAARTYSLVYLHPKTIHSISPDHSVRHLFADHFKKVTGMQSFSTHSIATIDAQKLLRRLIRSVDNLFSRRVVYIYHVSR